MSQNVDVKILCSMHLQELQQEISKYMNDGYTIHGGLVVDDGYVYVMLISFGVVTYADTTYDKYDVKLFSTNVR